MKKKSFQSVRPSNATRAMGCARYVHYSGNDFFPEFCFIQFELPEVSNATFLKYMTGTNKNAF